jgi:hypothetical protein
LFVRFVSRLYKAVFILYIPEYQIKRFQFFGFFSFLGFQFFGRTTKSDIFYTYF